MRSSHKWRVSRCGQIGKGVPLRRERFYGFDSRHRHYGPVVQSVEATPSEGARSEFESRRGYTFGVTDLA